VSPKYIPSPVYRAVSPEYCPLSPTRQPSPNSPSLYPSIRDHHDDGPPKKKTRWEKRKEKKKQEASRQQQQQPSGSRGSSTKEIPRGKKLIKVETVDEARKWYNTNRKCWRCGKTFHGVNCRESYALPADLPSDIEKLIVVPK
jgi:hypothetical protein